MGTESILTRAVSSAADYGHARIVFFDKTELPEQEKYLLHTLYQIMVFFST